MITAKEAREIPVKAKNPPKKYNILEHCEYYIRDAAEDGLNETEVFYMPDEVKAELIKSGYKVEITNIPNDPRMVVGWTISW